MKDYIDPKHRTAVIQNILNYLYQPVIDMHKKTVKDITQDMIVVAFKYKGKTYTPYTMGQTTKLELLPEKYREDFDKHLEKYNLFMERRIQIEWFLAELLGRARSYYEMYHLIPDPLKAASCVSTGATGTEEENGRIAHFKSYYRNKYELLGSEIVKRMLIT